MYAGLKFNSMQQMNGLEDATNERSYRCKLHAATLVRIHHVYLLGFEISDGTLLDMICIAGSDATAALLDIWGTQRNQCEGSHSQPILPLR